MRQAMLRSHHLNTRSFHHHIIFYSSCDSLLLGFRLLVARNTWTYWDKLQDVKYGFQSCRSFPYLPRATRYLDGSYYGKKSFTTFNVLGFFCTPLTPIAKMVSAFTCMIWPISFMNFHYHLNPPRAYHHSGHMTIVFLYCLMSNQ